MKSQQGGLTTIFGVAILAACTLIGQALGDGLGAALGVKANVGGVGIAMLALIALRVWLQARGHWTVGIHQGVFLWGSLYIPSVVAMVAQQDVVSAISGGPMVLLGGVGVVGLCFAMVAAIGRIAGPGETMDEIEAREALAAAIAQADPA